MKVFVETVYFQGELNANGLRDGRGVTISPGTGLYIEYWKKGVRHGPSVIIRSTGDKDVCIFEQNKLHGECTYYYEDGEEETYYYEHGKEVEYDYGEY